MRCISYKYALANQKEQQQKDNEINQNTTTKAMKKNKRYEY